MKASPLIPLGPFRSNSITSLFLVVVLVLFQSCAKDDELKDYAFTAGNYDPYDSYHAFEPPNRISGANVVKLDVNGDELRMGLHYYAGAGYFDFFVYTSSDNWEVAMQGQDPYIFRKGDPIYQVQEWENKLVRFSGESWLFTGSTNYYGPYWDYNEPHYLCFRKKEQGQYHHLWVHLKVDLMAQEHYLEIYGYALRGAGRN